MNNLKWMSWWNHMKLETIIDKKKSLWSNEMFEMTVKRKPCIIRDLDC